MKINGSAEAPAAANFSLPQQASLGAKSVGVAQIPEDNTNVSTRNPAQSKPVIREPEVILDISPAAMQIMRDPNIVMDLPTAKPEDSSPAEYTLNAYDPLPPLKRGQGDGAADPVLYAFDPLPPVRSGQAVEESDNPVLYALDLPGRFPRGIERKPYEIDPETKPKVIPRPMPFTRPPENEGQPGSVPPVEASNGKSSSPAFEARSAIAKNPELADRPFGQIVSLLARGLPLPIENPPENPAEVPPTDTLEEVLNVPAPTPDASTPNTGTSAIVPDEVQPVDWTPILDPENQLIREVLA